MIIEGLNENTISKLTSIIVDYVTCMECCKSYIAPETSVCGHTLCHGCWSGRRSCPTCSQPLDRKSLKPNGYLKSMSEHVQKLSDAFEKLFHVKLAEMEFELVKGKNTTKHVQEWLANSQNHFSAPVISSQQSTSDVVNQLELSSSNIQIHTHNVPPAKPCKPKSPSKKKTTLPTQIDWDKIEIMPDTEDKIEIVTDRQKENVIGPMDLEPFYIDENEYTTDNPRRSSRKKDMNEPFQRELSVDKQSSKNSSAEQDKKSMKVKQNWSNVKKMKKEFSKLNKKNKNKLNVSIEMVKKAKSTVSKSGPLDSLGESENPYVIEDNTPDVVKETVNCNNKQDDLKIPYQKSPSVTFSDVDIRPNKTSAKNMDKIPNKMIVENAVEEEINIEQQITENVLNMDTSKEVITKQTESNNSHLQFLKKGNLLHETNEDNNVRVTQKEVDSAVVSNSDDIEISIKIGNTITNILIKKKDTDVQVKVNTDREIQTSLGPYGLTVKKDVACSPLQELVEPSRSKLNKSTHISNSKSTKKNTASADTASANFEITESVEKQLSDLMECVEANPEPNKINKSVNKMVDAIQVTSENIDKPIGPNSNTAEKLNDVDLFGSGSVKESNFVTLLKNVKDASSEILIPTMKSKKSQKIDKRERECDESEIPSNKKQKINFDKVDPDLQEKDNVAINESEHLNYDAIMSQVFANIDADIETEHKSKEQESKEIGKNFQRNCNNENSKFNEKEVISSDYKNLDDINDQKHSENVFSIVEKDSEPFNNKGTRSNQIPGPETQDHINNLLTPGMCQDLVSSNDKNMDIMDVDMQEPIVGTPMLEDDSDKSVVEETPQKDVSFLKAKQTSELQNKVVSHHKQQPENISREQNTDDEVIQDKCDDSQIIRSIINISDTLAETSKLKDTTFVGNEVKKSLETPVTINKFVNHIQYKSTPVARKSLNFNNDNLDDLEQTLCPTTTQEKENRQTMTTQCTQTTQEKEFLAKAFEQTPEPVKNPIKKPLGLINIKNNEHKRYCLAGSCLTPQELLNVKAYCAQRGWVFVEKYVKELTHLVVSVDDENKSQRSVKYMCALAASKWIVSYAWIEKCLASKTVVDERPFEALDASGSPGPQLSRSAPGELFRGFTFYCLQPFSVLDLASLKYMLEAAGGRVAGDPGGVRVVPGRPPALLLAEPQKTQDDRFTYMAMELCVVPVNYEWVLNCLGSYALTSLYGLLLCPYALLPPATNQWPAQLMLCESEGQD